MKDILIRYWGRKPPELVYKYIENYSKEGDVVLDVFGGSGNIVKTALMLKRRAIYVDLNPFAELVAHASIERCEREELEKAVKRILSMEKILIKNNGGIETLERNKLFSTKCICNEDVEVSAVTYTRIYSMDTDLQVNLSKNRAKIADIIHKRGPITHEELVKLN